MTEEKLRALHGAGRKGGVDVRTWGSKTERERQANVARLIGKGVRYTYRCDDGELFSAVAMTEPGAFRVLNAERPGMRAELVSTEPEANAP